MSPTEPAGMPALAVLSSGADALDAVTADRAREFVEASVAWNTRRAYKNDWGRFALWCNSKGLAAMPAVPATVIGYLVYLADEGRKVATIERYYATLNKAFKVAGVNPSPCEDPRVKQVLAGIRRKVGAPQNRKEAAVHDLLLRMVDTCVREPGVGKRNRLVDLRDKALLLFGFAGAFRRSELMAVEVEHLTFVGQGVRVLLPGSKTDQEHLGEVIGIAFARNPRYCAVLSLQEWLAVSGVTSGRIFRSVGAGGRVRLAQDNQWLAGELVGEMIKRRARLAGLDPKIFGGHSLRSGFATQGFLNHKNDRQIMRHGRWRDLREMEKYIREVDLFRDNPTDGLL